MTEKQFVETYCHNCGTQRCEGIGTEWFESCKYKWNFDGQDAASKIERLEKQIYDLATKIARLKAENNDLFYKLQGVMWFVDKWLEDDELEQDEVNRAVTMREKTLQITEDQQREIEKLTLELEGIYGGVDLYKLEYDRAKDEVKRLQSMNQAKLDTIHDLMAEIERLKPFEKKVLEPVIKEFQRKDCPFSPFDEYCTGHCVNCENRLEWVDCSKRLKSEAYREFWDKLKKEADFISGGDYGFSFEIREDVAEDIIKELTEACDTFEEDK